MANFRETAAEADYSTPELSKDRARFAQNESERRGWAVILHGSLASLAILEL